MTNFLSCSLIHDIKSFNFESFNEISLDKLASGNDRIDSAPLTASDFPSSLQEERHQI